MKYYLIMFLMLWATSALAVETRSKPVQCGKPDSLMELLESAGEKALLGALTNLRTKQNPEDSLVPLYVFANTETGSFTIIEYHWGDGNGDGDVCVIGYGTGIDFDVQHLFEKKTES
jgi:hypothetical protein